MTKIELYAKVNDALNGASIEDKIFVLEFLTQEIRQEKCKQDRALYERVGLANSQSSGAIVGSSLLGY